MVTLLLVTGSNKHPGSSFISQWAMGGLDGGGRSATGSADVTWRLDREPDRNDSPSLDTLATSPGDVPYCDTHKLDKPFVWLPPQGETIRVAEGSRRRDRDHRRDSDHRCSAERVCAALATVYGNIHTGFAVRGGAERRRRGTRTARSSARAGCDHHARNFLPAQPASGADVG